MSVEEVLRRSKEKQALDEAIDYITKAYDSLGQAFPAIHNLKLDDQITFILELRRDLQELNLELGDILARKYGVIK